MSGGCSVDDIVGDSSKKRIQLKEQDQKMSQWNPGIKVLNSRSYEEHKESIR